jgi:glycosyltransferase involved in cell wall biosynthesis
VWRLAEEAGLKVADSLDTKADVYLIANAPRRLINEAMDRARAFLHATINEHWGIAVAEAMARGLPVVVHKSGGAWTDLAEEGRYGLGYETAEEAVEALARLLLQGARFNTVEKAGELTYPKFRERLAKVLGL